MGRLRSITARWVIPIAILAVLLGIVIWTTRPSPFAEWLRAEGIANERPVEVVSDWVHGQRGTADPDRFSYAVLACRNCCAIGLIVALFVLSAAIWPQWLTRWFQTFLATPAMPLRNARSAIRGMRVWLAMVLIAVFAFYLGWEIHAWRAFGVSDRYRRLAAEYAASEANCRLELTSTKNELAKLESGPPLKLSDESLTPAAQAAIRSYLVDSFRRGADTLAALCEDFDRLKQKYEHAAWAPGSPVEPDPPLHTRHLAENVDWPNWGYYLRAKFDYESLIRRYPDLYWAHERQAWLLATSPDLELSRRRVRRCRGLTRRRAHKVERRRRPVNTRGSLCGNRRFYKCDPMATASLGSSDHQRFQRIRSTAPPQDVQWPAQAV